MAERVSVSLRQYKSVVVHSNKKSVGVLRRASHWRHNRYRDAPDTHAASTLVLGCLPWFNSEDRAFRMELSPTTWHLLRNRLHDVAALDCCLSLFHYRESWPKLHSQPHSALQSHLPKRATSIRGPATVLTELPSR